VLGFDLLALLWLGLASVGGLVLGIVLHYLFKQSERKFFRLLERFMWKMFRPLRTEQM
jgi:hypothetical protein